MTPSSCAYPSCHSVMSQGCSWSCGPTPKTHEISQLMWTSGEVVIWCWTKGLLPANWDAGQSSYGCSYIEDGCSLILDVAAIAKGLIFLWSIRTLNRIGIASSCPRKTSTSKLNFQNLAIAGFMVPLNSWKPLRYGNVEFFSDPELFSFQHRESIFFLAIWDCPIKEGS